MGGTSKIIHFNRFFHYKQSILDCSTVQFSADGLTGDKLKLLQWHFAVLVFCRTSWTRTVEPMDHTLIRLISLIHPTFQLSCEPGNAFAIRFEVQRLRCRVLKKSGRDRLKFLVHQDSIFRIWLGLPRVLGLCTVQMQDWRTKPRRTYLSTWTICPIRQGAVAFHGVPLVDHWGCLKMGYTE